MERQHDPVPEPGEAVHLPGPSYLPVLAALAITVALVGIVISWVLTAIGLILLVVVATRWIRQTRGDISELPLDR